MEPAFSHAFVNFLLLNVCYLITFAALELLACRVTATILTQPLASFRKNVLNPEKTLYENRFPVFRKV
jgi:hypothetical protein